MGNPAGVRRNFEALERRRMKAAELLKQGVSQSDVALGCPPAVGDSLGAAAGAVGARGFEEGRARRAQAQAESVPTRPARTGTQARSRGAGLCQRVVDCGPGARTDRVPVWSALSRGPRLAPPAPAGLELPAT